MKRSEMPEEEVARYWNQNADLWAEHVRKGWDAYREHFNNPAFLRFIGDLNGKTVLDAGCGEGYNTRLLAGNGARMVGVDISQRRIEHARRGGYPPLLPGRWCAEETALTDGVRRSSPDGVASRTRWAEKVIVL